MGSFVYWLFLASGAAGLIYEVVWVRMLMRVLGATVPAYTIVLSAFMLGLALGGWYFGRRIDVRGRPLVVYAALEAGVGAWALLLPLGMGWALHAFAGAARGSLASPAALNVVRSALAFGLLLPPTALMGGTLPVLSRFLVQRERELGQRLGALYAVNTFGAILGAGAAGFYLIGHIGESRTTLIAVALNLLAATGAVLLSRVGARAEAEGGREESSVEGPTVARWRDVLLLAVVGLTGFTILAYEVLWTRTAILMLTSSVYSFSAMLLAFLTGIAIGSAALSLVVRWWRPDRAARWGLLAVLQVLIGVVAVVSFAGTAPVVGAVHPLWLAIGGPLVAWFDGPVLALFVLLAPLTVLSGASFPLAASLYTREVERVGSGVGAVYLWNTVGAAAGSAVAGFVLLPKLGIAHGFLVCVAVNVAAGLVLLASAPNARAARRARSVVAWAAVTAVVLGIAVQRTAGLRIPQMLLKKRLDRPYQRNIFYKEDPNGIVSVWINPREQDPWRNNKRLYIDGQPMAVAYRYGMIYERLQAHLPLLLHPDPKDVLVICLGTGTTLGSVGRYPVSKIDCVELSPSVVEAGVRFTKENHDILNDPRVTVHVDDGRNYLLATSQKYDVITAEPMHPHLAGTVNLYTKEYFELVKSRLRPGGVCSHWIPLHRMKPEEVKAAVQSFRAVFPHTVLFLETADAIILGSDRPLTIDVERWRRLLSDPKVSQDLEEVGLSTAAQLLATYMMDDEGLEAYAGGVAPVTDDRPTLEFHGSFAALETGREENIREIVKSRDPLSRLLGHVQGEMTPPEQSALERYYGLERRYLLAYADYAAGDLEAAREGFRAVLEEAPEDRRAEISLNAITPKTAQSLTASNPGA